MGYWRPKSRRSPGNSWSVQTATIRLQHEKQKPCIILAHSVPRNFYFIEVWLLALPQTTVIPPSPAPDLPLFPQKRDQIRAPSTAVREKLKQNGRGSGRLPEPRPGPGCAPERAVPRCAGAPCRRPTAWQGAGGSLGGRGGTSRRRGEMQWKPLGCALKNIYLLINSFISRCVPTIPVRQLLFLTFVRGRWCIAALFVIRIQPNIETLCTQLPFRSAGVPRV